MKETNWQKAIRTRLKELVREKNKRRLLAEARKLRRGTKTDIEA